MSGKSKRQVSRADVLARIAKMPSLLFSDMLPEPEHGRATYKVYEAARRDNGTWEISASHFRDYGTSSPINLDDHATIARGLDFVTMMDTMHKLETSHRNALKKRPLTGWRRPDVYREYAELWVDAIAVSKTAAQTLRPVRRHKPSYRRPS